MRKRCLVAFIMVIIILLSSCLICGCDANLRVYTYNYSVQGEGGTISLIVDDTLYDSEHSPMRIKGGLGGVGQYVFIAEPFEGYRVKQWICDDEIIQGNQNKIYISSKLDWYKYCVKIEVEFEPV